MWMLGLAYNTMILQKQRQCLFREVLEGKRVRMFFMLEWIYSAM